jgi:serine/threonine protein kinase
MTALLMASALILLIPESISKHIEAAFRQLSHLGGDGGHHLRIESPRTGATSSAWDSFNSHKTNHLNNSYHKSRISGRHIYHVNGTISAITKDHRYHHIAHRKLQFRDMYGEKTDDSMGIMYDTSSKSPPSLSTPAGAPIPALPPSPNIDPGSSTDVPKDPQLVIAGKMVVEDGACNIAQLNLKTGEWSLQQRIQLSLYNSYSGGEVYSLLANHTIVTNSNAKEFSKSEEPSSKAVDRPHVTDNAFGVDLIVVGAFDTTYRNSQTTYCSVGKWDGSQLSKVGEGLCNSALSKGMKITSSAIAGPNDIYVGGSFQTQVWNGEKHEFVKIFNIAHYNSINQVWLPLPVGQITCSWCTVTILALAWDTDRRQLHVAGKFNAIDGYNIPAGLAVYDQDSGHLVAHPGGGLAMRNITEDGVGTAIQFDQENGVLYVMGAFERLTATYEECLGLAAYEIKSGSWTCLADPAHSVLPTGGGNMLLTPYGLLVAGKTTNHTTWPDSSRPYTVAVLKATIKKKVFIEEIDEDSKSDDDSISDDHVDGVKAFADKGLKARRILDDTELRMNETNLNETKKKERRKDPEHEFIWSWLPGFEGHDEPIHTLSNGYGDYVGTVFIGGDNFISKWSYKSVEVKCDDSEAKRTTTKFLACTQKTFKPVTVDLSNGHVHGSVMAISQLDPVIKKVLTEETSGPNNVIGYTILVYSVTLGAVIGMFLALMCNKSINQTIMSFIFDRDAHMKGISLDTLTYSTVKNTNVAEAYHRAMSNRFVKHPHLLTLIDPQEIILHRIIGEGTFGRVWSAKWGSSSVAVKEFVFAQAAVAGKSSQQQAIVEEIIGEAGMMAILRHPNVLQLFGCSLTAQAIWIVSELCSLGSLRQVLDDTERVLTLDVRLSLALQVAEGMAYLHTQDPPIIHRDLKSHNIFVHETFIKDEQPKDKSNDSKLLLPWASIGKKKCDSENASKKSDSANRENGSNSGSDSSRGSAPTKRVKSKSTMSAKIGDWGSARATLAGSRTMTHGVGTACWMAPEVLKHARSSKNSDVYGFGIVLWELATRSQVYEGLESTQIIAMVANDHLRPEVPEGCPWNDLMVKCWNEVAQDRPPFEDIVKELNRLRPVVKKSKYTGESLKVPNWKAHSYQKGGSIGSQPKVKERQTG